MKNKGLIIAIVLVVVLVVAYFLFMKKKEEPKAVTTTQESTTGVAALFNTGAMTSLFGSYGKLGEAAGAIATKASK